MLLQTWEKTNELEIREFKLTQLKHEAEEAEENMTNGSHLPVRLNGNGNGERWRGRGGQAESEERLNRLDRLDRLVIIKLAEISGRVKGGEAEYSVIIKVLPTDDHDRYKVRQKFRQVRGGEGGTLTRLLESNKSCFPQLLKFSKEVQVYMKIIKCMYM